MGIEGGERFCRISIAAARKRLPNKLRQIDGSVAIKRRLAGRITTIW